MNGLSFLGQMGVVFLAIVFLTIVIFNINLLTMLFEFKKYKQRVFDSEMKNNSNSVDISYLKSRFEHLNARISELEKPTKARNKK